MTVVVLVETHVKPEVLASLNELEEKYLPATRAFPGCQDIAVLQGKDDPCNIIYFAHWDSPEDYEKYLAWRKEEGVYDVALSLSSGPAPHVRYFDVRA